MLKRLIAVVLIASMIGFAGCSQWRNNSPTTQPSVGWNRVAVNIESATVLAAQQVINTPKVAPYKPQIAKFADNLSAVLSNYDNRELTLNKLEEIVQIQVAGIADPTLREAVKAVADMVVVNAFDLAWNNYSDLVKQNEVQLAIVVGKAITNGLKRAAATSTTQPAPGATWKPATQGRCSNGQCKIR